jgi:hypothetical protein
MARRLPKAPWLPMPTVWQWPTIRAWQGLTIRVGAGHDVEHRLPQHLLREPIVPVQQLVQEALW